MGKPDGYIFWCSKCKVDHPGECETEAAKETFPGLTAWLPQIWKNMYTLSFPGYSAVIKIDDDDGK